MLGFTGKFAWFTIYMTLTLLYFTYVGIMTVTLTPNLILATLNASGLYALFNLFAGFIMPKPVCPYPFGCDIYRKKLLT